VIGLVRQEIPWHSHFIVFFSNRPTAIEYHSMSSPHRGHRQSSSMPSTPNSTSGCPDSHEDPDVESQPLGRPAYDRTGTGLSAISRRCTHSDTPATYNPLVPNWQPGQEPGIDTTKSNDVPSVYQDCDITVVDFSETNMEMHRLDNDSLGAFIAKQKDDWVRCRWINVNGLSWDVVKLLGSDNGLHRLAIEDMLHGNSRTKVDW